MLVAIPSLLDAAQLAQVRAAIEAGEWRDGRVTAGVQSALAKHNLQLANDGEAARDAGEIVLRALAGNGLFQSAALPRRIVPPLFNRYEASDGHRFGEHVDNALRPMPGGGRIRTDVSATLFLSDPADYDGGELVIEDSYGAHSVKLAAGDMILYPSTSLHRVEPVTRGTPAGVLLLDRIDGPRGCAAQPCCSTWTRRCGRWRARSATRIRRWCR